MPNYAANVLNQIIIPTCAFVVHVTIVEGHITVYYTEVMMRDKKVIGILLIIITIAVTTVVCPVLTIVGLTTIMKAIKSY